MCYVEKNSRSTSGLVCKDLHQLVMSAVGRGLGCDARSLPSRARAKSQSHRLLSFVKAYPPPDAQCPHIDDSFSCEQNILSVSHRFDVGLEIE